MGNDLRRRDLFRETGSEERVLRLLATGKSPAAISKELNHDPVFMSALEAQGYGEVQIGDVHKFMASRELEAKSALIAPASNTDAATVAIQAAKERIVSTVAMGDSFGHLTQRLLWDLGRDLNTYEVEREMVEEHNAAFPLGAKERLALPQIPLDKYNQARKGMLACLDIINRLANDVELKTIVKMQTVNISQGYTQEKLFDILFEVGHHLHVPRDQVMAAFTKAVISLKARNGKPIEADAEVDGNWQGRMKFAGAVLPGAFGAKAESG